MKIKKYTNSTWADLGKPVKKFVTYTDEATTLPLTIEASTTNAIENYQVYGASTGIGEAAQLGIQLDEPLRGLGDIKDTLDLSTGVLTRRIGVAVLDGTEGQIPDGITTRYFYDTIANAIIVAPTENQLCSHYSYALITTGNERAGFRVAQTSINNTRIAIRSPNTDLDTTEKYRAFYSSEYANGRPVTAYYVLANPVTEQVDVPSGLAGIIEGYLTQTGTPTESNPIYPEANGVKLPNGKYEVYADVYKIPILNTSGVTENEFDISKATRNKLINRTDGSLNNSDSYATSDFIECNENSKITISGISILETNRRIILGFYNASKVFIGSKQSDLFTAGEYNLDFDSEGQAKYYRFSYIMTDTNVTAVHYDQSNYDLFLGDSKLYEEEYLDYVTQKVYKRTAQLWDWVKRDVPNIGIRYAILVEAGTYTIVNDTTNKMGDTEGNTYNEGTTTTVTYSVDTWIYRVSNPISYNGDITVVSGSTAPAEHLPYYNIVDPPVPFPALHTYIGENNLSVDTTVQPEKVALTVAAWREIEAKKYANGSWTDIVVRRYENGAWVPSPIPENNIADLQGLLTLLEDHWLPGVNDYRSMILVRTNRNDDTANQLCYMLTCYSTNPSPHFESEFLSNRYWLNDYAVPYSGTDFYLRKFSWSQGGGWVYDGDEGNKRDDYFVPIDSNTYNVYLLRLGSNTQYDNNAGYQYFYDLSAYF